MGCDIHLCAEKKINNKWETVGIEIYQGRNYDLFSILAGVRNGYGFAGTPTGSGFEPIDVPRGTPSDVSDDVKGELINWEGDGHSYSYFTLKEIKEASWDKTSIHFGIFSAKQYYLYLKNKAPVEWSSGVFGQGINYISNEQMEDYLKNKAPLIIKLFKNNLELRYNFNRNLITKVEWKETYREAAGNEWWNIIENLEKIDNNLENIRLVFWFDN